MKHGFTVGNIKKQLRLEAKHIAGQYSLLWTDLVHSKLVNIERTYRERMSEQVYDDMFDYGMDCVRKAAQ